MALRRQRQPAVLCNPWGKPGSCCSVREDGDLWVLVRGRRFPSTFGQLLRDRRASPRKHNALESLAYAPLCPGGNHHPARRVSVWAGPCKDLLEWADRGVRSLGFLPGLVLLVRRLQESGSYEVHAEAGRVPQHAAEEAEDSGKAYRELTPQREHNPCFYIWSQGLPDFKRQLHLQHAHARVLSRQQQELLRVLRQAAAKPEREPRGILPNLPSAQSQAGLGDQRLNCMRARQWLNSTPCTSMEGTDHQAEEGTPSHPAFAFFWSSQLCDGLKVISSNHFH